MNARTEILNLLRSWNHQKETSSAFNIAFKLHKQPNYVSAQLRQLCAAGLIIKHEQIASKGRGRIIRNVFYRLV